MSDDTNSPSRPLVTSGILWYSSEGNLEENSKGIGQQDVFNQAQKRDTSLCPIRRVLWT